MKTKKFRAGQKVQSIFDPTHVFVIDKSQVPERIFHEKGSNRWWTTNELQRLGAPENPSTFSRLNGTAKMRGMHPKCAVDIPAGPQIVPEVSASLEVLQCLGCSLKF